MFKDSDRPLVDGLLGFLESTMARCIFAMSPFGARRRRKESQRSLAYNAGASLPRATLPRSKIPVPHVPGNDHHLKIEGHTEAHAAECFPLLQSSMNPGPAPSISINQPRRRSRHFRPVRFCPTGRSSRLEGRPKRRPKLPCSRDKLRSAHPAEARPTAAAPLKNRRTLAAD